MEIVFSSIVGSVTFGTIISIVVAVVGARQTRRELTLKLHEEFHSSDYYVRVRAPAYRVALQWNYLPDDIRQSYRDIVASGWSLDPESEKARVVMSEIPADYSKMYESHFQKPIGEEYLTEHQAVVALLNFWSRVNMYRTSGCIEPRLVRKILQNEFKFIAPFFFQIAKAVQSKGQTGQIDFIWIKAVRELDSFFHS